MARTSAFTHVLLRRVGALPEQPGVYLLKDAKGRVLYVGKAISLRKRVSSYFQRLPASRSPGQAGPTGLSPRIVHLIEQVRDVDVRTTASEAEALLLESQLIKEHHPKYNVAFRDDKSYPLLKVTHEPFPRLLVTRRRQPDGARYFGPYADPGLLRQAVQFLRRVFPLRTCRQFPKAPCLEYHIGQCLAPCVGYIEEAAYTRIVDDLLAFLEGKRDGLLRDLARRMHQAARHRHFEEAARVRDQIQALTSVIVAKAKSALAGPLEQLQLALKLPVLPHRIEAFDISNIYGAFAVGSMVAFVDGRPFKAHYRHFRIETVRGIPTHSSKTGGGSLPAQDSTGQAGAPRAERWGGDDYQMMREVMTRRYTGSLAAALPWPDLILVDGGRGQLNAALEALKASGRAMPVLGLAKQFEHIVVPQQRDPIVLLPTSPVLQLVQHIRDEAHRFAITYHRRLRGKTVDRSALDAIPGIGPKRKATLLKRFGSVATLRRADPDTIAATAHISREQARRILTHLTSTGGHDDASTRHTDSHRV